LSTPGADATQVEIAAAVELVENPGKGHHYVDISVG
jgi:hypothetical protein